MKRFVLFFIALLTITSNILPQTGSDYYLPLQVGNYVKLYCPRGPHDWLSRYSIYKIEGTDIINGILHYREVAKESLGTFDLHTFRVIWLRKDESGGLTMGAISPSGSTDPDSAIIINSPYFPNEFLTEGFSRYYPFGDVTFRDSILSTSETVFFQNSTFTKCISLMVSHFDKFNTEVFREIQYYAPGVGIIYNDRSIPEVDAHTDQLVEYNIITDVNDPVNVPAQFSLNQNFPNPFNPATEISYSIPEKSFVTLKIYDILGNESAVLQSGELNAGTHSVQWNASGFPSGVYFCRLESSGFTAARKLILLK